MNRLGRDALPGDGGAVSQTTGLRCRRRAGFIHSEYIDHRFFAAEFQRHFIERADSGDIPEMGAADACREPLDCFLGIERLLKWSAVAKDACPITV